MTDNCIKFFDKTVEQYLGIFIFLCNCLAFHLLKLTAVVLGNLSFHIVLQQFPNFIRVKCFQLGLAITDVYFRCDFINANPLVVSDVLTDQFLLLILNLNTYYSQWQMQNASLQQHSSAFLKIFLPFS